MHLQTSRLKFDTSSPGRTRIAVSTPDGVVTFDISHQGDFWFGEHIGFYARNPEPKPKRISAKQTKRASIAQEREVMETLGGRRQPGSGALEGLKGDGRVRNKYRVEMKMTRQKSYAVTRAELAKIRGECHGTERPLFVIDFVDPQTGGSADRWILLEFEAFKRMDDAAGINR
jgi:hypothetical protein